MKEHLRDGGAMRPYAANHDNPNLTEWWQEIIPTSIQSKTECYLNWSRCGCKFGENWNNVKRKMNKRDL